MHVAVIPHPHIVLALVLVLVLRHSPTLSANPSNTDTALLTWMRHRGFATNQLLVEPHTFASPTRRGMRATADLKSGDVLLAVPGELILGISSGLASSIGPRLARLKGVPDFGVLAVHLMYETSLGDQSKFAPYILNVENPPPPSLCCSTEPLSDFERHYMCQLFHDSDDEAAAGPSREPGHLPYHRRCHFVEEIERQQRALLPAFQMLDQSLFAADRQTFPAHVFTLKAFARACATVVSRSFTITVSEAGGGLGLFNGGTGQRAARGHGFRTSVLVPFADLFNHDANSPYVRKAINNKLTGGVPPVPGQRASVGCYGWSDTRESFIVRADRDYKAGEEVLFSYGRHDSRGLASKYGFVQPSNQYDDAALKKAKKTAEMKRARSQEQYHHHHHHPQQHENTEHTNRNPFPTTLSDSTSSPESKLIRLAQTERSNVEQIVRLEASLQRGGREGRGSSLAEDLDLLWKSSKGELTLNDGKLTARERLVLVLVIEDKRVHHHAMLKAMRRLRDVQVERWFWRRGKGRFGRRGERAVHGAGASSDDDGDVRSDAEGWCSENDVPLCTAAEHRWVMELREWDRRWVEWTRRVRDVGEVLSIGG